jgi:hypothetical protein
MMMMIITTTTAATTTTTTTTTTAIGLSPGGSSPTLVDKNKNTQNKTPMTTKQIQKTENKKITIKQ